jgi:hypothetical protein
MCLKEFQSSHQLISSSVERETISTALPSLSSPLTVFMSSISSLPLNFVMILDSSEIPPATLQRGRYVMLIVFLAHQ